jgi:hypothetical protein
LKNRFVRLPYVIESAPDFARFWQVRTDGVLVDQTPGLSFANGTIITHQESDLPGLTQKVDKVDRSKTISQR